MTNYQIEDYYVSIDKCLDKTYFFKNQSGSKAREPVPLPAVDCLIVLVKHTGLRYLRTYSTYGSIYLYFEKYKCYLKVGKEDLSVVIGKLFATLCLPGYFYAHQYLKNLIECSFCNPKVAGVGHPKQHIQSHLVAVSNGFLDVKNRCLLENPSPELFVVGYLPYPYHPDLPTPCFDSYMKHVSGGIEDKKRFLMAYLNVVVLGDSGMQCFLYIYGPGGTGKTIIIHSALH